MGAETPLATVSKFTPGTSFVEAYGLLTASLLLGNGTENGTRIICLTAARPGDGTTTTAMNLALTMAGTGRKTLLVDANFRAPRLHKAFNTPQSPGLIDVLMNGQMISQAVHETSAPALSLLPAGALSGSPQIVLQSGAMRPLLDTLRGAYSFVIVDTAPALRFPDALHVARAVDGTLVVVPSGRAPRGAAIEVRRRLERVGVKISGVVLNRATPSDVEPF